jgi:integrase/recombinase XerD
LQYGCLPENLDDEQIDDYLVGMAKRSNAPSKTSFKHTVYGLRFYFKLLGFTDRVVNLPSIHKAQMLPIVFSQAECRQLFKHPTLLKHRVLLSFIYSTGIRVSELCNMHISDVDFDRMQVYIRQGKGQKDRYVPLSTYMKTGLQKYLQSECPQRYLFEGKTLGAPSSVRAVQWLMRETLKKTGIAKQGACVHTLRHSYATHLLEDGVNIMQIKNLLGHNNIDTTMRYLHVIQPSHQSVHSPLDTLYAPKA